MAEGNGEVIREPSDGLSGEKEPIDLIDERIDKDNEEIGG